MENKIESVGERSGKENVLTEEGGEQDCVESCIRGSSKNVFREREGRRDGRNGCGNLKGDLLAESRIILKQLLQNIGAWNGFMFLRIGTSGWSL